MKTIYVGGPFTFFYKDYTPELLKQDFRYRLIGEEFVKQTNKTVYVGNVEYTGPFYYYQLGQTPTDVVTSEIDAIRAADYAYFVFSDKNNAPGTIAELVHAAVLNKVIRIYYVKNDVMSEASDNTNNLNDNIHHPYWYPFLQAKQLAVDVKFFECETYEEAINKCIETINNM